jgi:hypothetical protein
VFDPSRTASRKGTALASTTFKVPLKVVSHLLRRGALDLPGWHYGDEKGLIRWGLLFGRRIEQTKPYPRTATLWPMRLYGLLWVR